jgi:hypothetical protein
VGKHAYTYEEGLKTDPPREDGRRCLSVAELQASDRFARNAFGRWTLAKTLARSRRLSTANLHYAAERSEDSNAKMPSSTRTSPSFPKI